MIPLRVYAISKTLGKQELIAKFVNPIVIIERLDLEMHENKNEARMTLLKNFRERRTSMVVLDL